MGCGASAAALASDLESSRLEVERLHRELKASEKCRATLEQQLKEEDAAASLSVEVAAPTARAQASATSELVECEAVVSVEPSCPSPVVKEPPEAGNRRDGTGPLLGLAPQEEQVVPQEMDRSEHGHQVELPGIVVHDIEDMTSPAHVSVGDEKADGDKLEEGQYLSLESTASTCSPALLTKSASICSQCFCETTSLFLDPSDLNQYCKNCWIEYYGHSPLHPEPALVPIEVSEPLAEELLAEAWSEQILPGWPPPLVQSSRELAEEPEIWTHVRVRLRRDVCGGHAREHFSKCLASGELLAQRYRVSHPIGEGHFTKAFDARDLKEDKQVCIKRHRNLPIEALGDLYVIRQRLQEVDPGGNFFPVLFDAFYDSVGFTVESMLEGRNCLAIASEQLGFFQDLGKLRLVAFGALSGLVMLDKAGIVHNDIKPDNLIWTEGSRAGGPRVKIVDFGCARIDQRHESGRNWALAEGGAGHLGKWAPEMTLRLAIGHRADIWGTAVSLCELLCGRMVWRTEMDTAEVVMTQALGLCNLRDGVPPSLLRRSPLDVRQLYTPAPRHWPLRRNACGQVETLRPVRWGLEQVLGQGWQSTDKLELGQLLIAALVLDPSFRPSAAELLECCSFLNPKIHEEC
mmetsp:Transcript_31168/g.71987  ORF Transcript_31168/g.71987 Transcript_31168/m.71987 type:complete len:632 (+) Transcript_31168:114-2009(+)